MRELALGARLTLAGGRAGLARTGITAVAVGLGVAALLFAAALPSIRGERLERGDARAAEHRAEPGPATVKVADVSSEFRARELKGWLLEPGGPGAPLPPGLDRMPAPGEVYVSPALRDLMATDDGRTLLAPRIPGRIVGMVAPGGLLGPSELAFYAGARGLGASATSIDRFGATEPTGSTAALGVVTAMALAALLLPVGVLVGAAVRIGGEARDRRLAALRLVGADQRMTRRIAAGEALVAAGGGVLLGALGFLVIRANVERITLLDLSVFASDVRPSPALALLVAVGVPAAAVLVSLLALQRVVVEPLGVVRQTTQRRRRLWWRLLLPGAGLLLLATAAGKMGSAGELRVGAGVIALLVGVAALLPWVVERTVARLGGGPVAWQLAVRRLQLDPGGPVRAVSGIAVAVAGAIALQLLFTSAQEDFKTETRQDPSRATLHATIDDPPLPAATVAARLAEAPGASSVTAVSSYGLRGRPESALHVAPCAELRQLFGIVRCADGDLFRTERARPDVALPGGESWRVPATAQVVAPHADPAGRVPGGVFATPAAVSGLALPAPRVEAFVRVDPGDLEDAVEQVRVSAAAISPLMEVQQLRRIRTDAQFDALRRAMLVGATGVMVLIGLSLLLTAVDQLRERRRLLAVLVAFGTRRSTLGWSLLWQSAIPVGLGLGIAVLAGLALGVVLARIFDSGDVHVGLLDVAAMAGSAAAVVLAVTAATLPLLWRTMRPEALRTE